MKQKWFLLIPILWGILCTGCFLDQTVTPKPSDIIVSLGGKGDYRKQKGLSLLKQQYSLTDTMIQTGQHVTIFTKHDDTITETQVPKMSTKNTLAEIRFIKNYLQEHNLSSALVVSDPPHSRRILFFANTVYDFPKLGLSLTVVGSDSHWWGLEPFYISSYAHEFIAMESLKYLYYSTAYYLGLLEY